MTELGKLTQKLPNFPTLQSHGKSCYFRCHDDGYPDICCAKLIPAKIRHYPSKQHCLINDGKGNFSDKQQLFYPKEKGTGMVTASIREIDLKFQMAQRLVWPKFIEFDFFDKCEKPFKIEVKASIVLAIHFLVGGSSSKGLIGGGWVILDLIAGKLWTNPNGSFRYKKNLSIVCGDFDENEFHLIPILECFIGDKSVSLSQGRDELLDSDRFLCVSKFTDLVATQKARLTRLFSDKEAPIRSSIRNSFTMAFLFRKSGR